MAAGRTIATAPQTGKCWHCSNQIVPFYSTLHEVIPPAINSTLSNILRYPPRPSGCQLYRTVSNMGFFPTSSQSYSTLLNMGHPHKQPALYCHTLNYIPPQAVYLYSQILDYIPSPVVNSTMSNAADISTLSNSWHSPPSVDNSTHTVKYLKVFRLSNLHCKIRNGTVFSIHQSMLHCKILDYIPPPAGINGLEGERYICFLLFSLQIMLKGNFRFFCSLLCGSYFLLKWRTFPHQLNSSMEVHFYKNSQ